MRQTLGTDNSDSFVLSRILVERLLCPVKIINDDRLGN